MEPPLAPFSSTCTFCLFLCRPAGPFRSFSLVGIGAPANLPREAIPLPHFRRTSNPPHSRPPLRQLRHTGLVLSHFWRRDLQVQHPSRERFDMPMWEVIEVSGRGCRDKGGLIPQMTGEIKRLPTSPANGADYTEEANRNETREQRGLLCGFDFCIGRALCGVGYTKLAQRSSREHRQCISAIFVFLERMRRPAQSGMACSDRGSSRHSTPHSRNSCSSIWHCISGLAAPDQTRWQIAWHPRAFAAYAGYALHT